jgi:hypothetical protein
LRYSSSCRSLATCVPSCVCVPLVCTHIRAMLQQLSPVQLENPRASCLACCLQVLQAWTAVARSYLELVQVL